MSRACQAVACSRLVIMSAIDFKMDLVREPDPKGDRVKIVMSGKFLPYRTC